MSNSHYFMVYGYIILLYSNIAYAQENEKERKKQEKPAVSEICFGNDFAFGVATSAFQIEGAWNTSGKGESIWDRYTHQFPERVADEHNGDVAVNSYNKLKDDIEMLKSLEVNFYRFSVSWPRILPNGYSNVVNPEGIKYYQDLIDELYANKIAPVLTMYHWDLPQSLQDIGGWTNPIIADYFADYARVLFDNFGDKVKVWITFNEPLSFCHDGYGGLDAPGSNSSGLLDYMCAHNVLRAHGKVYHVFDTEYRKKYGGHIGITLDYPWMEPASNSPADRNAAETARQFMFGWYAHPIFSKQGDYPSVMRAVIDAKSKSQGYHRSRLPSFTHDEVKMIRGSSDYMGLNQYTTYMVKSRSRKINRNVISFEDDMNVNIYQKEEWPRTNSSWLRIVPWGFRKALNWIRLNYNNPTVLVTENGVSFEPELNDTHRISFIDAYLRQLHEAIHKDGCSVIGYTYWSLMDNFEWLRGFTERFGLFQVDYESADLKRIPRASAKYFNKLAKTGCIPETKSIDNTYYIVDQL